MLLAKGTIRLEVPAEGLVGATAYVRIEDVTHADALARIVAESVMRDLRLAGGEVAVTFFLDGSPLDTRRAYNLRVHVDLDGDGQIGPGDYLSTRSYPILASDTPATVTMAVRRV